MQNNFQLYVSVHPTEHTKVELGTAGPSAHWIEIRNGGKDLSIFLNPEFAANFRDRLNAYLAECPAQGNLLDA